MRSLILPFGFAHFIAMAAFAVGCARGQDIMPVPGRLLPPQLVIATPAEFPVRLKELSVRAQVSASMAMTEIAMTFYNPNRRVLEGELKFPLLDGQQVLGFAMDVNGKLRDAVPVDKARGRAVFEDVTRTQIDPGLLETSQGNNFRLRVYPIPPLGTKQVVLRYSQALGERNGRLVYRLPLEYATTLEQFRLDIDVAGAAVAPVVARGGIDGLKFERSTHGYHGVITREKYAGRGLLELEIVRAPGPQAFTQTFDGKTYFYAEIPVASHEVTRALPAVVGLIWDSSGSGAARDHVREFALLDAYFRQLRDGEVRLVRVRDIAEATQSFRIVNGDWRALRAALEAQAVRGRYRSGPDPTRRVRRPGGACLGRHVGDGPGPVRRQPVGGQHGRERRRLSEGRTARCTGPAGARLRTTGCGLALGQPHREDGHLAGRGGGLKPGRPAGPAPLHRQGREALRVPVCVMPVTELLRCRNHLSVMILIDFHRPPAPTVSTTRHVT